MSTYLIQFGIYTLAMVGIIFVCLLVAKKTLTSGRYAKNNNELCIENVLNLSQRKTLYVIKAGDEKFLIAGDAERTSVIAKLNDDSVPVIRTTASQEEKPIQKTVDYGEVLASLGGGKKPVLREMIRKLNAQNA